MEKIDIKDFISTTIIQICDGIKEAKEVVKLNNYNNMAVAPATVGNKEITNVYTIDFKISVTYEKQIDGNVKILALQAGGEINNSICNQITFSVPYIPAGIIPISENGKKRI